jgi:predicted transcriptional regulator
METAINQEEVSGLPPSSPFSSTRRGTLEVVLDVLRAIEEGAARPSYIIRRANISHPALMRCTEALRLRGLVVELDGKFFLTDHGKEFASFSKDLLSSVPYVSDYLSPKNVRYPDEY